MKRGVRRASVIGGSVLALLAAFGAWLVGTESGFRAAWRLAAAFLPAEIEVGAVNGRLVGPLVLTDLGYATQELRARVERIELDWQPSTLLRGVLTVDRVSAAGVDVVRLPTAPAPAGEPWRLPEQVPSPIDVHVAAVAVEDLRFRPSPGAKPIVVDDARFALRFDEDALEVDALDVRGPLFDAAGRAEVAPRGRYPAELELDVTLRPPGRPDVEAAASGSGTLDEMRVRIDVEAPYALEAEVVVADVLERAALDGTLRARIVPADIGLDVPVAEAVAELDVAGPLADLRVMGHAEAAMPELVDAELDFGARWVDGALEIESLEIAERSGPAAVRLTGRVDLDADTFAELEGEWSGLRWPLAGLPVAASARGTLVLTGTPSRLDARVSAEWDADGRIDGRIQRDGERLDIELDWRDVSWPPTRARLESGRGALRVSGTLDDYALSLDADLAAERGAAVGWRPAGAAGHVRAEGRGSRRSFALALVDVAVLDGELQGSGRIEWDPAIAAAIDVELVNLDPGLIVPEWTGRISGGIEAQAAVTDAGFAADVERLDLAGTLRGQPIDLDAQGGYEAPNVADIERLTLRSGMSTFSASGRIGDRIDVEWRVDSPDLEDFWPGLAGSLMASGHASGPRARPLVEANAVGDSLAVNGVEIGSLALAANVDIAGAGDSSLALDARDARIGGRSIERLELRANGDGDRHRLSAEVAVDGVEAALALNGGFERLWTPGYAWRFEIDEGRIGHQVLSTWSLDAAAAGRLTADGAELERACLTSGDAALCFDAALRGERTEARLELTALPFEHFAAYWPGEVRMTGALSAEGLLELAPDVPPRATLTVATTPARIGPSRAGAAVPALAFEAGVAALALDADRLDVELELPIARGQGGIDGRATVTFRKGEALAASGVDGRLRAELANLAVLSGIVPGVDATAGSASMDVALSGTIAAPVIAGDAIVENGSARLSEPGIAVEQIDLALSGGGNGEMTIDGSAMSGGGSIEADGVLRFAESLPVGRLALRGSEFEVANTPDAQVWVSPDLQLELTPERMQLTGSVLIPRARFTPRDSIEGAVTVSSDQIIVDTEEPPAKRLSRPLHARVALSLGDEVTFEGFGLTGTLGGALELVEVPTEPVTGSGELRVESGTYEAYGQVLDVRTGRLVFAGGAISRPGLDIEAVRRPTEDILVGARVRGTLDRPQLSVFSEPAMPREEQLSYLLLGRPLENASSSETSALSQAAMALGLRGGNFVSERLNRALGFDEFGIQTQPAEASAASFVIGKYLTPSLYVSYGVGLFEPVNTLRLRYTISRRWRLVTESSTAASGGDLIYHIERGD